MFSPKSFVRSAAPVLLLPVVASIARAQIFQYDIVGNNSSGFGYAVNRIGDVDKDGYEDFIVGAPWDNNNNRGAAIVFSGISGAEILRLKGANDYSELGWAVEGRADLDGDGYPDILVGAPGDAGDTGYVLAYSPHLSSKLYKLAGPAFSSYFGSSIRSLEVDIDSDGIDDFIVGAPGTNSAYVYSGKTGAQLFSKTGQSGSLFGTSVCRAGDLDGDHVCDFLVGSPYYADASLGVLGRVSAFSGATGMKLWSLDGPANDSRFGNSIAEPGDLDGDGVADCVVGAPADVDASGFRTGSITVISGATGASVYKVTGDADGDYFGWDVRGVAGDIDKDGVKDFIVGAPYGLSYAGFARTLSGASGAVLHTYVEETSDPTGFYGYGRSVAGGDFNGDGRTDVLIGNSDYNNNEGLIEIFDAAVASWWNYGIGWGGTLGVPAFTAGSNPILGQSINLTISNSSLVATPGLFLLGASQASILTSKGGTLLVDPLLYLPLSLPVGSLTVTGTVPSDPAFSGVEADLQVLELDAGASKGISFTEGLDLLFGFN
jgi:hypothetical protein